LKKCHNCNRSKIVDGYSETIVTSIGVETKYYCHECLTVYAEKNVVYHSVYTPKLRDTKIDEYNAVINDFNFIPYADKWKTASYYHYERLEEVKN
jgi:hypothetical protein